MIKGMFVGLDGSPVAESVMESGEPTGGPVPSRGRSPSTVDTLAHDYLRRAEPQIAKAGVPVSSAVLTGDPAAG